MLQSMGSQRVGYDWATEQQQKSYFLGESITWKYTFSQKIELRFKSGQTYIVSGWIYIYSDNLSEAKINLCWKLRSLRTFTIFNIKCLTLNENLSSILAKYNKNKKCEFVVLWIEIHIIAKLCFPHLFKNITILSLSSTSILYLSSTTIFFFSFFYFSCHNNDSTQWEILSS